MQDQIAPWTNHVRGWAPSHKFIKTLKLWYPHITGCGYLGSEGWRIGHNHAIKNRSRSEIDATSAHKLLIDDLIQVQAHMERTIKCEISEGQYMAIMSWIFDIGHVTWETDCVPALLYEGYTKECLRRMSRYKMRNGQTDIERSIRRAAEVEWWNLT